MNRKPFAFRCIGLVCAIAFVFVAGIGAASAQTLKANAAKYAPDKLLVRFTPGAAAASQNAAHNAVGATVLKHFNKVDGLEKVKLPPGLSVRDAIKKYRKNPNVSYAEPDFTVHSVATTNDPLFDQLWGLSKINAPGAWDSSTGNSSVVVAVIDSGVDYNHPDLAANIYSKTAGCTINGIDDCHGADFVQDDFDAMDDNGHGTHVAGTIGAIGNNHVGVVGVNWTVTILPCKFLDATGFGDVSDAIACLDYVADKKSAGLNIVATNNSWGGYAFSQALYDAIKAQADAGILFIAAAGDNSSSNDTSDFYPANYFLPNVIAVNATDSADALALFSNYGRRNVHVGAPGKDILSTLPGNTYGTMSGTSMAAPHVTGVAALLEAQDGTRDWRKIRNLILAGGDNDPALSNTVTKKRLNAFGSLNCSNNTTASRLRPIGTAVTAGVGTPVDLAFLNIKCDAGNGNVDVTVNPGSMIVTLRDDASPNDQAAGDGVYSARWTPANTGVYTLTFPGGDVVTVKVVQPYTSAPTAYDYRDITVEGTNLNLGDDASAQVTSPFPILFGGGSYSTLYVGGNGIVTFDGPFTAYQNGPLPTSSIGTLVAPFWDDLYTVPGSAQNVFSVVTGASPNRELVIEWRNVMPYACSSDSTNTVKFQVVFKEGKSDILFNYADVSLNGACAFADQGASASVGVQVGSVAATQYSLNGRSPDGSSTILLTNGTALLWTAGPTDPAISVTPTSLDFGNVAVGAFADRTFTVQNVGGGTLSGPASTASPFSIFSGSPFSLGAGAGTSVVVRFTPTSATSFSGNVNFTSNASNNPSPIVSGSGVGASNVDLVETALGNPPGTAAPGGSFSVSDTAKNNGTGTAATSTTQYYLSTDQTKGAGDILLGGSRSVPSLAAGASSNGNATLTIPSTATLGTYHLLACADDLSAVSETNETNNCRASTGTVQLARPDLTVTAVQPPSAPVAPGGTFIITDTVKNLGAVAAAAFTVKYYLSSDAVKDGADVVLGSRALSGLNAGSSSNGSLGVTVPSNTSPGMYYVFSCADDPDSVTETNEANNCLASTAQLNVTLPDLAVTAITLPIAVVPGGTFTVTDTVKNQGTVAAGGFIVTYYLSTDASQDDADTILGNRPVSSLTAGQTSNGSLSLTIPSNTAVGRYYVLSCADTLHGVNETNELNNCLATRISVTTLPDLVTTAVSNPPATVALGGSFKITDTVQNQGTAAAGASTTRYYLSLDRTKDLSGDLLFTQTRAVGSIKSGSSSSSNVNVTVPSTTPRATYYVLACADDSNVVPEFDDANNCIASTSTVNVQ